MKNELKAKLTADVEGLKKGMKQAEKSLDDLSQAERDAIKFALKLKQANDQAGRSYKGLSKSSGASTVVFQEFNRSIQDAPFGMMGVSNNIQQLASNFGALTKQTGGVGPAIKESFRSAITGINPLILAVTVITAAWTAWEMGMFGTKAKIGTFTEELDKFVEGLGAVNKAMLAGTGSGMKSVQSMKLLVAQAENLSISDEKRLEAVEDLQKIYPEYLGNLSKEQILTGNVGDAYDMLTKSIIATAKARAFSDQIAKNSITILSTELRLKERVEKLAELDRQRQAIKDTGQATSMATAAGVVMTEAGERMSKIQGEINDLVKEQIVDVEEVSKLSADNLNLEKSITKQLEEGAKFTKNRTTNTKEGITAFEAFSKAQDQINKKFFAEAKLAYQQQKELAEEAIEAQKRFEELVGIMSTERANKNDPFGIAASMNKMGPPQDDPAEIYDPTAELQAIRREAEMTEATFEGLGRAVSLAFGGGSEWGRFLGQFLSFTGQVIARNFAVSKSNVIAGATASGAAAGPFAAIMTPTLIAQGLTLIGSLFAALGSGGGSSSAGGSSQQSITYGMPGREKGGPVSANQPYIVGERRAEVFEPKTAGTVHPSISSYLNSVGGRTSGSSMRVAVEVHGYIENDAIAISNKRGERRRSNT